MGSGVENLHQLVKIRTAKMVDVIVAYIKKIFAIRLLRLKFESNKRINQEISIRETNVHIDKTLRILSEKVIFSKIFCQRIEFEIKNMNEQLRLCEEHDLEHVASMVVLSSRTFIVDIFIIKENIVKLQHL